jgi:hypothetical protein
VSGNLELGEQAADPAFDLVADRADGVDVQLGRIFEDPVLVAAPGEHRAGVTTAHRHDDVRGPDDLVGPRLRELAGDATPTTPAPSATVPRRGGHVDAASAGLNPVPRYGFTVGA